MACFLFFLVQWRHNPSLSVSCFIFLRVMISPHREQLWQCLFFQHLRFPVSQPISCGSTRTVRTGHLWRKGFVSCSSGGRWFKRLCLGSVFRLARFYRDPSSFKCQEITELFGDSKGTFSITHIYQCTLTGRDTKIQAPPKNKQKALEA